MEESIYDKFVEAAAERAKKRTVGNPFDPKIDQGPQVSTNSAFLTDKSFDHKVDLAHQVI